MSVYVSFVRFRQFLSVSVSFCRFLSVSFCFVNSCLFQNKFLSSSYLKYHCICPKFDLICPKCNWISTKYDFI